MRLALYSNIVLIKLLNPRYPDLQQQLASAPTPSAMSTSARTLASLLSVSLQNLDSEAEMRKFFGSKVISAAKSSGSSGPSSRSRQVGTQKSHLTRPQPSWWAAKQREGLSIWSYDQNEIDNKLKRMGWGQAPEEKWWTVEYSKKYKSVTMSFMQAVNAGGEHPRYSIILLFHPIADPEVFWRLLQKLPWHADTLLQLSEVYRHREGQRNIH